MARASEEILANIHSMVANGIKELIHSEDPREMQRGLELGLKFLKDNNITTRVEASEPTRSLADVVHKTTPEDLERLMRLTPSD